MTDRIVVESLSIEGFRAFLREQTLSFGTSGSPKSLGILASNAHGKSSIVDAVEYFFSEEGSLSRLGERDSGTKVGRTPMTHVLADAESVTPRVSMHFRAGQESFGGTRPVLNTFAPIPGAAHRVASAQRAEAIIRGVELRAFVESRTPEERYTDLARWFELKPITEMQAQLRNLRRRITSEVGNLRGRDERLKDVRQLTSGSITTGLVAEVLAWINTTLVAPLNTGTIASLANEDQGYKSLADRAASEESATAPALASAMSAFDAVASTDRTSGALPGFLVAARAYTSAVAAEEAERTRAQKQVFEQIWTAAEPLLLDEDLQGCPVCQRTFEGDGNASRLAALAHVKIELAALTKYKHSLAELRATELAARSATLQLTTKIEVLQSALSALDVADTSILDITLREARLWKPEAALPEFGPYLAYASEQRAGFKEKSNRSPTGTATAALAIIDGLRKALDDLAAIDRESDALKAIQDSLLRAQQALDQNVRKHVEAIVRQLHDRMNEICASIQSHMGPPPVYRLELPATDDRQQQRLYLRCDYGPRKDVAPQGYLSDAQMNILALALRLSAIQLLNARAPFIVLDDIVTSYDVDHRKAIACFLASDFGEMQILLVTHDTQFFEILRDQLPANRWSFKRITAIDAAYGPRFSDHLISDEKIAARWNNGESAGNDIRQAEEDWLFSRCREFGAKVTIREPERAHKYDRSELAQALMEVLKSLKIKVPASDAMGKPILESLKAGVVENFSSHFQVDPASFTSLGDERKRWSEFVHLRGFFECSYCHGHTFSRARGEKVVRCSRKGCAAEFRPGDDSNTAEPHTPEDEKSLEKRGPSDA